MKFELKWTKRVIAWWKRWDPAFFRSNAERELESAVLLTAERFKLRFVEPKPVVGVQADIVIRHGGLSICGVSGVANTGIPARTLARSLESHIRQLTTVDWDFEIAGER